MRDFTNVIVINVRIFSALIISFHCYEDPWLNLSNDQFYSPHYSDWLSSKTSVLLFTEQKLLYLCRLQEESLNLQPLSLFSHLPKVISVRSRSPYPYIFSVFDFSSFLLWRQFIHCGNLLFPSCFFIILVAN